MLLTAYTTLVDIDLLYELTRYANYRLKRPHTGQRGVCPHASQGMTSFRRTASGPKFGVSNFGFQVRSHSGRSGAIVSSHR